MNSERLTHIPDSVSALRALSNISRTEIGVQAMPAVTYGEYSEPNRVALWLQLHDGPLCVTLTLHEAQWLAEAITAAAEPDVGTREWITERAGERQEDEQHLQHCSDAVRAAILHARDHGMTLHSIADSTNGLVPYQAVRAIVKKANPRPEPER
jgi:hypothetical protein